MTSLTKRTRTALVNYPQASNIHSTHSNFLTIAASSSITVPLTKYHSTGEYILSGSLLFQLSPAMAATQKRPEIIDIARGLDHVPMCEDYERMVSGML